MGRVSVVVVGVLLAVGLLSVPMLGLSAASPSAAEPAAATADTGPQEFDRPDPASVIRVNVTQDGHAEVAIESRFLVNESDDNRTAAFETLYQDVQSGEVTLLYSEETFRSLVADVSASAGREMAVEDARWTRSISNDTGVIAFRFTWTNFAIDRQETVVVGDAFRTDRGQWLPTLGDQQRLVVRTPDDYAVLSPSDRVGEQQLVWDGPHEFEPGAPSATFGGQERTPGTTTTTIGSTTTTVGPTTTLDTARTTNGTGDPGESGSTLFWVGLLVVVLSVGGGGYWYFANGETADAPAPDTPTTSAPETDDAPTDVEDTTPDAATVAAGATAADDASDDDEDDGVDPELLSDEERVEHLLESNGGRMKQAQIVKETGWSNAKVSQLLSSMDDNDRIDKLRIGRENLITLPDEDVTDI